MLHQKYGAPNKPGNPCIHFLVCTLDINDFPPTVDPLQLLKNVDEIYEALRLSLLLKFLQQG
jgi:hypothetical protein